MNKILIFVGAVLFLFGGLVVLGYHFFGLGGAVGGLVVFLILTKVAVGMIKQRFKQIGKALFESKSRVLRDATATVHEVCTAPRPENAESTPAGSETRFYFVDVTIKPAEHDGSTPFSCWDCSELMLVPFDAPAPNFDAEDDTEYEGPKCQIHDVIPMDESEGDEESCTRDQRLKLHVEVPRQTSRLKFQYYFETFGEVVVPS